MRSRAQMCQISHKKEKAIAAVWWVSGLYDKALQDRKTSNFNELELCRTVLRHTGRQVVGWQVFERRFQYMNKLAEMGLVIAP